MEHGLEGLVLALLDGLGEEVDDMAVDVRLGKLQGDIEAAVPSFERRQMREQLQLVDEGAQDASLAEGHGVVEELAIVQVRLRQQRQID